MGTKAAARTNTELGGVTSSPLYLGIWGRWATQGVSTPQHRAATCRGSQQCAGGPELCLPQDCPHPTAAHCAHSPVAPCLSFPSRAAQQSHPAAPTPCTPPGGQTKWVNGGGSATQIPLRCPRWDCVMAHIAMAMPPLTTRVPAQSAVGASMRIGGGQPQPQPPPLSRACFPQGL